MVIRWHLFLEGRRGEKRGERKQSGGGREARICVILKGGENSHLCYLEKGRGQNGSTLIPTTDLRNYYRLSLSLSLFVCLVKREMLPCDRGGVRTRSVDPRGLN